MSEVPTSTPVPMAVISRSWRGERENDNGSDPAPKELAGVSMASEIRQM